jgi:S1-C subfamily serine protease
VLALTLSLGGVLGAVSHDRYGSSGSSASAARQPVAANTPAPSTGSAATSFDAEAIAAKVVPAVVNINTTLANGAAAGTGMVITASGEVLTNNHVINGATSISVQIGGTGAVRTAKVLGYSVTDDVALLQIEGGSGLKTVTTGKSTQLLVNDDVVAIGNALGRGGVPANTAGTVAALNQTITASDDNGANSETLPGMIQIAAGIQPGDSGGPLVDANGRVVGMTTAAQVNGGRFRQAASNTGYAIPIERALSIVHQIEAGQGSTTVHIGTRAILGVQVQTQSDASVGSGASVADVQSGSTADSAGIGAGDVIITVEGKTSASANDLTTALAPRHAGDKVDIGWVDASGQRHTQSITLASGPPL